MADPYVTVRGLEDLGLTLRRFGIAAQTQLTADGIQAGAEVLRAGQASLAPHRTGFLASNIVAVYSIAYGIAIAKIGPVRDAFYGAILEHGTKAYEIKPFRSKSRRRRGAGKGGGAPKKALSFGGQAYASVHRGPMARRPFISTSLVQDAAAAVQAMQRAIFFGADRIVAALAKGRE